MTLRGHYFIVLKLYFWTKLLCASKSYLSLVSLVCVWGGVVIARDHLLELLVH